MPAVPSFILQPLLNGIKPILGTLVNGRLVDIGEKYLNRFVLPGASMREDDIDLVSGDLSLHKGFDGIRGLFVVPPSGVAADTPICINAVCTTDDEVTLPLNIEDLSVFGKENSGVCIFHPNLTAVPIDKAIGGDVFGTAFVVSVDTENRAFDGVEQPFAFIVKFGQIIISAYISKDDKRIVTRNMDVFCKVDHAPRGSVDITCYVNHSDLLIGIFSIIP
jgi:hypothetical protein